VKFQPKTDREIAEAGLLPVGEYDYEVAAATEKVSRAGNQMIELELRIFVGESVRMITDYLLDAMAGKLKHFCESHGMGDRYEKGTLAAKDCVDKSGRAKVGIKKDKSGAYPDKNTILDYIVKPQDAAAPPPPAPPIDDDDVPF
jgi:hypothetical protein